MFTQREIETIIREFLIDNYEIALNIPVTINGRLTSTLGKFRWNRHPNGPINGILGVPTGIEISRKYLENGRKEDIISTIKHEAIHFALFVKGIPHRDGDEPFESELIKHGVNSTGTSNYKHMRHVRVYTCECEDDEHIFLRTIAPSRCTVCKKNLLYKERRKEMC